MACLHNYSDLQLSITLSGKYQIVKLLLSRGADVDGKSEQGTPLSLACLKGHESTVEVLLEYHADVLCLVAYTIF